MEWVILVAILGGSPGPVRITPLSRGLMVLEVERYSVNVAVALRGSAEHGCPRGTPCTGHHCVIDVDLISDRCCCAWKGMSIMLPSQIR